jgi:D-3-phosphoglycerate dehydrogenase
LTKPQILVTGLLIPQALDLLRNNFDVEYAPGLSDAALHASLKKAHGMIIRTETLITKELLTHAPNLKVICRSGVGIDNIDLDSCSEKNIIVMNTPEANRVSAAEHTLALILALAKQIPQANSNLHLGKWNRADFTGMEISQKTLGIIGYGNIGKRVASRAKAFEMKIIAHDPYVESIDVKLVGLDELLKESDFVTFHVPLTKETKDMANDSFFKKMKKSAFLVNTSRGKVINETSLSEALKTNLIKGAALDVFADEPLSTHSPYLPLKNVILTPHVAGQTFESQKNMSMHAAEQIENYFLRNKAENVVKSDNS